MGTKDHACPISQTLGDDNSIKSYDFSVLDFPVLDFPVLDLPLFLPCETSSWICLEYSCHQKNALNVDLL